MHWYPFFLITTISAIKLNTNLLPSNIQCQILPNLNRIFKKFNFPVMLHIDNFTAINWNIEKPDENNTMTVIVNYDNKLWKKMPQRSKFIQLINTRFLTEDFNRLGPKLSVKDVIVLFQTNKKIPNNILKKFIRYRLVFVFNMNTCKIYICFYGENSTCNLKMFGLNDSIRRHVRRKSLEKFTIGYATYSPYVYRDKNMQFKGIEIKIVDVLSRKFNFTYNLTSFDQVENNRSNVEVMISKVVSKEISWGIGAIFLTLDRLKYFRSVTYINMEGFSMIFDKNFDSSKNYTTTFVEFNLISLLFACLISLIVFAYCRMKKEKFKRYVNLIFFPVYEQPQSIKIVRGNFLRFFFLLWWLSCTVLTISFKVFLFRTNLRGSQTIPTIFQLVENGFEFKSSTVDYAFIKSQCRRKITTKVCQLLMPKFSTYGEDELCQTFQEMFRRKLAIIGELTATRFLVYSQCNMTDEPENHQVQVSRNSLFGAQMHFWPTQENYILTEGFSKIIKKLTESGILLLWQKAELGYKMSSTIKEKNNVKFKAMTMNKLILPLVLLFIGLTLAFFAFLSELKRNRRKIKAFHQPISKQ